MSQHHVGLHLGSTSNESTWNPAASREWSTLPVPVKRTRALLIFYKAIKNARVSFVSTAPPKLSEALCKDLVDAFLFQVIYSRTTCHVKTTSR
jgi:hypothetical protein